ncbi:MAG: hypothetical protein WEA58_12875 [Balneolaceae bacterium]
MSYNYAPEIEASGFGFTVLKPISKRYSAGFSYDHYFSQQVVGNEPFFARRYHHRVWMSSLFVRAEAVQWRSIQLYGKAGFLYHNESGNGTVTTFNDVSPYQATTGWFQLDDHTFSMVLGGGVEWVRYLRLFAEPNLLLIDPLQFTISTGIRIPL